MNLAKKVEKSMPLVLRRVPILGFEDVKLNDQNQIIFPEEFVTIFSLRQETTNPKSIVLFSLKDEINEGGYKKRMLIFDDLKTLKKETIPGEEDNVYYYIDKLKLTKGNRITITKANEYFNSQQLYLTGKVDCIEMTDYDPRKNNSLFKI